MSVERIEGRGYAPRSGSLAADLRRVVVAIAIFAAAILGAAVFFDDGGAAPGAGATRLQEEVVAPQA